MDTLSPPAVPRPSRSELVPFASRQGRRRWELALQRSAAYLGARLRTAPLPGVGLFAHSQVRGRVLETALTLHLLRREGVEPRWQQSLRTCLEEQLAEADAFSQLIASHVLGHQPCTSARSALDGLLRGLQYGMDRKRQLLLVLLVEVGLLPASPELLASLPSSHPSWHLFSRIYAAACRLILYRRQGRSVDALPEAAFLRDTQGLNGGWEQQALLSLVALLGLGRESSESFEQGLRFLRYLERPDGSIPFVDNIHIWVTALSGLALRDAGGSAPSALLGLGDYLASMQSPSGGWSFADSVNQQDTDSTTHCLMLLQQLEQPHYANAIARGHHYLLRMQRPDGGYPTYVRGGDSEVTMTACAVQVQARMLPHTPALREPLLRGMRYLVASQRPDGTFEQSWSLCETYSLFRVLWALEACQPVSTGQEESLRQGVLRYLLEHQLEDGSWGRMDGEPGDVLSTAYAVSALCLLGHHERLPRALEYLLSQQSPDGAFPSRPDQMGPRPFMYDEPLLGSIFSIMALGRACRALATASSPSQERRRSA